MPNAPAKRAASLMIVIGVLLLAGSFLSTMYALLRPEWIDAQLRANSAAFPPEAMPSRKVLIWIIAGGGALGLIESGLSIMLGLCILRGRRWAITTSLVLTLLRLLIVVVIPLLGVLLANLPAPAEADVHFHDVNMTVAAGRSAALSIGAWAFSSLVLMVLAVWLIQAIRTRPAPTPLTPVSENAGLG